MGQPVLIANLAEQLIRLSGKEPGVDINIEYTGLRPGEKLHEELFHDDEDMALTGYQKIHLAQTRKVNRKLVDEVFAKLVDKLDSYDGGLSECIKCLVPEYKDPQKPEDS
jgi:FlaA1/EpsC-like NDP-sugar epimerase